MTNETPLTTAKVLASVFDEARTNLETFLTPFREQYFEFIFELKPTYYVQEDGKATTFIEVENEYFNFEGEPYYEYGDYETPTLSLPFAFVEDPEKFMADARAAEEARQAKANAIQTERAQERVELLRKQLAQAEASLAKTSNA
jgi:hypothetical protein